jgi:hypothetical protein
MIDQDLAHHLRGNRQKMHPIALIGLFLLDQPGVGFVDQGRGLKRMAGPFAAQMAVSDFTQFGLDQRNQIVQGGLVAVREGVEQHGDGTVFRHALPN